jgi:hypothetical protein
MNFYFYEMNVIVTSQLSAVIDTGLISVAFAWLLYIKVRNTNREKILRICLLYTLQITL